MVAMAKYLRNSAKEQILEVVVKTCGLVGSVDAESVAYELWRTGSSLQRTTVKVQLMRYAKHGILRRQWDGRRYQYGVNSRTVSTLQNVKGGIKLGMSVGMEMLEIQKLIRTGGLSPEKLAQYAGRLDRLSGIDYPCIMDVKPFIQVIALLMAKLAKTIG